MNIYMTEEEQLQRIREWLKNYGPTVFLSLFIAIVISLGWRYWQARQERLYENASVLYEQLINATTDPSDASSTMAEQLANQLISNYSRSPYASFAAFYLSKAAIQAQQWPNAQQELNWVLQNSRDSSLRDLAKLRLARVYIEQKQYQSALDILQSVKQASSRALMEGIRGDAYALMGNIPQAQIAYQNALQAYGSDANPNAALIVMKLSDLQGSSK